MIQRGVQQLRGGLTPTPLARHLIQREQARREGAVVLQHAVAFGYLTAQARAPQPAVAQVQLQQRGGTPARRLQQVIAVQSDRGFDERGDRQPVPGGHGLVVAAGLDAHQASGQQRLTDALPPRRVFGVAQQLQHRAAALECSRRRHLEKCCRPGTILGPENLGQLLRGPHIGGAFGAVGIGIQGRDEQLSHP
ncbi:Uncharacterised protein [Mycobacteroides abscessus subsp. abscessus]|nr:Uncharacterised protein [Mycobacteroides abscessus subsp. abscessus]